MANQPRIVILPSPGMGHLIPLVEFAKRLVQDHSISITFAIPTDGPPSKAQNLILDSLSPSISSVFLPPVDLTDAPGNPKIETIISLTLVRSLPALRDLFNSLSSNKESPPVALVVDLFGTDAFDVAKEFNISPFIFFPSTAQLLSFCIYLPELDQTVSSEFKDLPERVKIPGCVPVPGKDLLDPVQDRNNDAYKWILHHTKRYKLAEGIMVNTFMELEGGTINALQEGKLGNPTVYPVGPLVNMGLSNDTSKRGDESECLSWLDNQPYGSVIFVSFGSGGTLSSDQIKKLALGLESSGQRFIWVVRSPNDSVADASFFNSHSKRNPFDFLPQGFLERTKNRGLVVSSWAPQAEILSHSSTGGFLSHCGWNSTLESVVNGVPLIAWPLYAEQKMNAIMLHEDIKVALRPKANENGVIESDEIGRVVKGLMEGEEGKRVRKRMKDLKDAAAKVLGEDGSSTKAMFELASNWKKKIQN